MIISASYKTDIPAFYGEWFINRLRAGYCLMNQPFNRRTLRVSLLPEDVEGYVFWTKNLGPFFKYFPEISRSDRPFMVQYTINGYPRQLENHVPPPRQAVAHMRRVADTYGPRAAVWRYDPILLSSLTDPDFHRRNFASLASELSRSTDEAVVSFAHYYRKTTLNLRRAAAKSEFTWHDPTVQLKRELIVNLSSIAAENGMRLSICSQPEYQSTTVGGARCIDAERLASLNGQPICAKISGNRPGCLCHASRDIGEYDTCPHGCIYCYAVQNHDGAATRFAQHDPASPYLFAPRSAIELT